jgi:cytoskeletal protein RodZ
MSDDKPRSRLSLAGWLALCVLLGFLAFAIWYGIVGWAALGDVEISGFGWFALIAGSVITIAVGAGLMALVFYSSRNNMDR